MLLHVYGEGREGGLGSTFPFLMIFSEAPHARVSGTRIAVKNQRTSSRKTKTDMNGN